MTLAAQILGNRFAALAHEGAAGFAAMSRSPLVIEEGQYAFAILDGEGQLIAQDQGEPSHLAAIQATAEYTLDAFAFDLTEGDVILTGDPYCGGTRSGVLTIIVPVFWDGDLKFLSAVRFAVADLAGNVPGPFQPDAHEIWQESLRLTPVKLVKAGAPQKDVRNYITRNTRATALLDSDLTTAMVTATRIGEQIIGLIENKGLDLINAAATQRIEYGAARAKTALADLTSGKASVDGASVSITTGNQVHVDLSKMPVSEEDSNNLTLAATRAVVLVQLLSDVIEDAGMSQGILDAVKITAPEGSTVNATFPAALSCGWRVVAPALSAALAQATGTIAAFNPAPPMVILFDEIGSGPVTQPIALSPGFSTFEGCAGSDAASGRRRIISAEETEAAGRVNLWHRQIGDNGVTAELTVTADNQEAIVVPGGLAPEITGATVRERSNVLTLPAGSKITFTYPKGDA